MLKKILFIVSLCSFSKGGKIYSAKSLAEPELRYDYTYIRDANGWFKLHFSPLNWEDARLQCYQEGAILASPLDKNLVLGLSKYWQKLGMCPTVMFSGVNAKFAPGIYTSVEGVPMERMTIHWSIDEPVFFPEGCLVFYSNGTMASKSCNDVFPFICYKKHSDLVNNECGTIDDEYHRVNPEANTCYKCHTQETEWSRAFAICQAEGAHLAIINETKAAELNTWIISKLQTKIAAIGFKNIGGTWWDIHGNLMEPQTTTSSGKKCGALKWDGKFEDIYCGSERPFICEKTIDSLFKRQ